MNSDADLDALFNDEVSETSRETKEIRSVSVGPKREVKGRWLVKMPGFISVQANKPYSRDSLEDDLIEIEDRGLDEAGRTEAYVKLACTIRMTEDGQSNCRLLRWSDGSMTMAIGRDQFEVQVQPMKLCYLKSDNEIQGSLKERMALRPFIMADQSHRRYTFAEDQESSRVKMAVTLMDPEAEKQRMVRAEQEKIKNRRRLEAKQKQQMQKHRVRLSASLEEGFDAEDHEEEMDEEDADFINDDDVDVSDDEVGDQVEESEDEESEVGERKRKRIIEDDDD